VLYRSARRYLSGILSTAPLSSAHRSSALGPFSQSVPPNLSSSSLSFSVTAKRFVSVVCIFNVFRWFLFFVLIRVCENVISMNFCAIESKLMRVPVPQWLPFRRVAIALYGAFKWAFRSRVTSLITSSSFACCPEKSRSQPEYKLKNYLLPNKWWMNVGSTLGWP